MVILDSLTGKKIPFKNKSLKLFVCGPTVYDYPHIGNARTYVFFDIFAKFLRARGFKVFYLQNITDVDDKIIERAKKEKTDPKKLAAKFEKIYHSNEKALGITSVNKYARATDFIPQIIKQIQTLIKKGNAYLIPGDGYYFDVKSFPDYGKLARRTLESADDAISRIDENVKKKNRGDFALWKFFRAQTDADDTRINADNEHKKLYTMKIVDGEPAWFTPIGWGRPGWHIEDTAITERFFGPQYDIHGGALDLKFPHHEAEIAQQESASGKKPLAKVWMHTGLLTVNGKKMSKSLNNFITVADFLKKHSLQVFRYMVLSHHYRTPMNYTPDFIRQAENSFSSIQEFITKLGLARQVKTQSQSQNNIIFSLKKTEDSFFAAMEDDLNSPMALSYIFEFMNSIQKTLRELNSNDLKKIEVALKKLLGTLGFTIKSPKIPAKITALAQKRELFRRNKQFIQGDALRKKIEGLGYEVEDTPAGPFIWKNTQKL